ncbi:hypothetical protein [Prosthecobacter vanneervenii]|uniref:Uncharacterized protein n=1 Tax=Prosthecobacter vanneervenii TaxID=48466 RepID=A0A7W7Y9I1_9BACT|nr:hypothetical protein [Prosthecobacter vanneervenii]MBB5032004.1 hypothetical protein [Prosthecobacter vanneervenii]
MKTPRTSLRCAVLAIALSLTATRFVHADGIGVDPPYTDYDPHRLLLGRTLAAQVWDDLQARKNALVPITLGAWHWWRIPTGGPGFGGYGSPTLPGTYYYYVQIDPLWYTGGKWVQSMGLHADMRFREGRAFRSTMSPVFWPFEAYAWAETTAGVFKAGQLRRRLGIEWDGSFYGNVAYYDGFKLNSDIGVSWEHTFWLRPKFSIESTAQFFFREDGISSGLSGADTESTSAFRLQNNAVFRVVPTWWISRTSSLALGLTGSIAQAKAQLPGYRDHALSLWGIDLTYTRGRFKTFAEVLQRNGAVNPTRYVSGGMSTRTTDFIVGTSYATGPVTWRMAYSAGYDAHPGGRQFMFVPGVTIALTQNIDLYLEYVKWRVTNPIAGSTTYENGFQVALNWRF